MKRFFKIDADGSVNHIDNPTLCRFGLTEGLGLLIAGGLGSLGVGAATAGTIGSVLGTGIGGALVGGGLSALTGGSFGKGALAGGVGGMAMGALGLSAPGLGTPTAGGVQPSAASAAPAASDGWGGGTSALGQSAGAAGALGPQAASAANLTRNLPATINALGAIGSLLNRPQTPSVQMPPGFNAPWNPSGYINRSFNSNVMPASGNWQTYGQGPEQLFYNNNQVTFPNTGWPPPPPGHAHGGAMSRYVFSTGGGQNGHVTGDGGGQDDNVNARLSPDEYVVDATTLSRLGDGSSREGARRMDQFREAVAHDSGSNRVVQKKVKAPQAYLKEVRSR